MLNYETARTIAEESHRAFSVGDVEAVLETYTDDFYFKRNAEDFVGTPLIIKGKDAMRSFLKEIIQKRSACPSSTASHFLPALAGRERSTTSKTDRPARVTLPICTSS